MGISPLYIDTGFGLPIAFAGRVLAVWLMLSGMPALAESSAARFDQGVLWSLKWPGKPHSFLFGTLHVSTPAVVELPTPVEEAFHAAHTLAGEVLLEEASIERLAMNMLSTRPRLPDLLGEEVWSSVDALLASRGVAEELRAHLKPWAALLWIMRPPQSEGVVLDDLLQRRARAAGKTVLGLETAEEQLAVIADLPEAVQLLLLHEAVRVADQSGDLAADLIQAYLARDLKRALSLHEKTQSAHPDVKHHQNALTVSLLNDRNRRFVDRLMPRLESGGVFIAVGALHLPGVEGMAALLEKRGFALERLY